MMSCRITLHRAGYQLPSECRHTLNVVAENQTSCGSTLVNRHEERGSATSLNCGIKT